MCGKKTEDLFEAIVEGSMLSVCKNCSKHGNVIRVLQAPKEISAEFKRERVSSEDPVEVIVEDYTGVIKKAREKMKLTQEQLAKDVGERESVIHQTESGKMKPNFSLAKKLNVYLKINLIEKAEKIDVKKDKKDIDFEDKTLTIGDLLKKNNE